MNELVGYFDDSGNVDEGIVVVAGYVASPETWQRFGPAWVRALEAGNRTAREYKSSDCRQAVKTFKDWTRDECDALTSRVVSVIVDPAFPDIIGFGSATFINRSVPDVTRGKLLALGHLLCTVVIIGEVVGLCDSADRNLQFVFDRQPGLEGPVRMLLKQAGKTFPELITPNVQPPRFADSATEVPLQAADLLAYETYKELKNRQEEPQRQTSGALERLLSGRSHVAHYFDQERFTEFLSLPAAEVAKGRLPWPVYDSLSTARMDLALQRLSGKEAPPREPSWVDELLEHRPERLVLDSASRTIEAVTKLQRRITSLCETGDLSLDDARRIVPLVQDVYLIAGRLGDALRSPNQSSIVPVLAEYAEALESLSDHLLPEIAAAESMSALIIHMESAAMLRHSNRRRQPALNRERDLDSRRV